MEGKREGEGDAIHEMESVKTLDRMRLSIMI